MKNHLAAQLAALEQEGLRRRIATVVPREGPLVDVEGRQAINLASNDYLGLAAHPALRAAANRATAEQGTGARGSRLVTGTLDLHLRLEESIARLLGTERALLFGSGYLAHLGAIPALVGEGDILYSDERNHASIVDACRLSRATLRVYRHRDVNHLAFFLAGDAASKGRRLIITETVFSMDGDEAPLEDLCQVAEQYGAWLMVDEAHAFGIRGPGGAGLGAETGLGKRVHVWMGTLGKAAGSYGAYVAGCAELVDVLINRARTFIYSTALPPATVAASLAAIEIIAGPEGDGLRADLWRVGHALQEGLVAQGWRLAQVSGPIFPLLVGDPAQAVAFADRLLERGILLRAMRYPTVPRGTDRLRLVASAALLPEHIQKTLTVLDEVVKEL